jgi:stage V sporulation protein AD
LRYFKDTGTTAKDYDAIFTGDLGVVGSELLIELAKREGYDLNKKHKDFGEMIYDIKAQDVHAGGSGCGCSATVLSSFILPKLERGEMRDILYIATGALLSPMAILQGKTIPGIAHLIRITKEKCL